MYNILIDECFEFSNIGDSILVIVLSLLAIVIAVLANSSGFSGGVLLGLNIIPVTFSNNSKFLL